MGYFKRLVINKNECWKSWNCYLTSKLQDAAKQKNWCFGHHKQFIFYTCNYFNKWCSLLVWISWGRVTLSIWHQRLWVFKCNFVLYQLIETIGNLIVVQLVHQACHFMIYSVFCDDMVQLQNSLIWAIKEYLNSRHPIFIAKKILFFTLTKFQSQKFHNVKPYEIEFVHVG